MKIIKTKNKIYLTRIFVLLLFGLNLLSVAEANNCNSNEFSITNFKFNVNPINTKSPFSFQFSLLNDNQCNGSINVAVAIIDSQNQVISHLYQENIQITFISDVVNVSFEMNTPDNSGTYKIITKISGNRGKPSEFLLKEFSICNKYLNANDFSIENLKLLDTPIYSYSSFRVRFDLKNKSSCAGIVPPLQAGIFDYRNTVISSSNIIQNIKINSQAIIRDIKFQMQAVRDVGNYKIVIKAKDLNNWKTIESVELPVCSKDLRLEDFVISDFNIKGDITRVNSTFGIQFNLQKNSPCKNMNKIVVKILSNMMVRPYPVVSTIYEKEIDLGLTYPISIPSVKVPNILTGQYYIVIFIQNINGNLEKLKTTQFTIINNNSDFNHTISYIDKCIQKFQRYFGNKTGEKYPCSLGKKQGFICQNTSGGERLQLRLKNNRLLDIHRVTKMALDPNNKKWYFFYNEKTWSPDELNLIPEERCD